MNTPTVSCPYCNSSIPTISSPRSGQRIRCPRCWELLPASATGASAEPTPFAGASPWTDEPESADRPTSGKWSNAKVAGGILVIMAVMAGIGLSFAWVTKEGRRKRDHLDPNTAAGLQHIISIRPERLPGLAYMPADVGLLAGVRVAELMADETGRNLLLQLRANPALRLADFERSTGFSLEDIDHVVVGIVAALPPQVVIAVRTREPYDADKLRANLKAHAVETRRGRALSRFSLNDGSYYAFLWCPDNRTFVVSLQSQDDLPSAAASPSPETMSFAPHFAPAMQKHFENDLNEGTQAWVLGTTEKWQKVLGLLPMIQIPEGYRTVLGMIDSFAGGMQFDDKITWRVVAHCPDAKSANRFDDYLKRRGLIQGKPLHLFVSRPGTELLEAELSESLTRKQEGERVLLEARTSIEALQQLLSGQQ